MSLFNNSLRLLSRNLPLRAQSVRGSKTSLSYLTERCACMSSTSSPTFSHNSIPANRRYFISVTNPLYKRAPSKNDDFDEDDIEEEDDVMEGDQIMKTRLASDRFDSVLKVALNMSKNKIEKAFFADRIRINGERPKKKSHMIEEGDVIDLVRKYNDKNPEFLDVSRVVVLKLGRYDHLENEDSDDEAKMPAKLKRTKQLTIENYSPPFKGNLDT